MLLLVPLAASVLAKSEQDDTAADLLTVYQQAVTADPQLESAHEALLASGEQRSQAVGAAYLPQSSVNANISRHFQDVQLAGDSTGLSGRSTFWAGDYSLSIMQPILHYDRLVALEQADSRIAQAETHYAAAESDLLLRVAERYFDVLAAEDDQRFARISQQSLEQAFKETRERESVGFLAMTDVREAEAGADRAAAESVAAEHRVRDAREALREVIGRESGRLASLRESFPMRPPDPADERRWVELALVQNLSITAATWAAKAASDEIRRQWAGHLPTLDAVGNHSFISSGGRFGAADTQDSMLGLSLTIPLYQGGQVSAKSREALHRYNQALADMKQAQRSARHAASRSFLGVVAGIRQVEALQKAVRSAESALKATQAGFKVGRRTTLDLLLAERELLRTQRDHTRARYDYVISSLRLKQSVGTLSNLDLQQINGWLSRRGQDKEPAEGL